ncbi:MAG: YggS family pyridoxal phosphate-dependent enzyme [Acidimicrobiia bacterium]
MADTGLIAVRERIAEAAQRAVRSPGEISLVVVTKYASDAEVEEVVAGGATDLGETRADSIVARAGRFDGVRWHFVGRLQGNKVRKVRPVTDLLHSLDRAELAGYWGGADVIPPVLVQVNVGGEPQKGGISPSSAAALVELCIESGLAVRGLMTVPPRPTSPQEARPWFESLRLLRDSIALDHPGVRELSMGMSDDFEAAVAEGATILRVGRAIFGPVRSEG